MALYTRLHLDSGECVVWQHRMALRSLWPFWLLGLVLLPLYGLGLLFWLYAAVKWIRIRYLVTTRRAVRAEDHYAFLLRVETRDVTLGDIRDMEISRSHMGRLLGYADVTIRGDGNAITISGLRDPCMLHEILRPYL
ncbi:MAG: hypothetical protein R6U10_03445 [Thermoplasmatota archaeon]